ncbi:MAG TPA: hypothetical protein DDY70_03470, partial [Clostridiales bacterium]|nr:hypothetical protein [Clostridiales bacterium]
MDIDDLSVKKISGETGLKIIDCPSDATLKGAYDFDTGKPTFLLRQNGDANGNDNWAANRQGFEVTDMDGDGNRAMVIYLRHIYQNSPDRVSPQIELSDAIGSWGAGDVGKTYRVTFRVKADKAGTVRLGMMKEQFCNAGVTGSLTDGNPDAKNYAWYLYDGAPETCPITTVSIGTEWKTVVYEFTVDQKMLPIPRNASDATEYGVTRLSMQSLISGFGLTKDDLDPTRAEETKDLRLAIDDIAVYEVTKSEEKSPYAKDLTVSGWDDLTNYSMYTWADGFMEIADGGIRIFPAKNGAANKRANGNANILFKNFLSDILTSENVGRTYHISFRAKAGMTGYLDYGFTTNKAATRADGSSSLNYRLNFYEEKSGVATITETDRWERYGFDFTLDAGMLSENLSDTSAVFGFAIKFYGGYSYKNTDNIPQYYDTEIDLADFSICEVGTEKNTSSLPLADSVALTGEDAENDLLLKKGAALPIENVKKTYLSFSPDKKESLYAATLRLTITQASGESISVFLVGSDTPIATFIATVGAVEIDLTPFVREHAGETFTLCLASDAIGGDVLFDAGSHAPTLVMESEKTEVFDPAAFRVKANITLSSDFLYHLYIPVIPALTGLTLEGEA